MILGLALIESLVLMALVIAYLLDGLVSLLNQHGAPRALAVTIVFLVFMVSSICNLVLRIRLHHGR